MTLNWSKLLAKLVGIRNPSVDSSKFSAYCQRLGDGEMMFVCILAIGKTEDADSFGHLAVLRASEMIY